MNDVAISMASVSHGYIPATLTRWHVDTGTPWALARAPWVPCAQTRVYKTPGDAFPEPVGQQELPENLRLERRGSRGVKGHPL